MEVSYQQISYTTLIVHSTMHLVHPNKCYVTTCTVCVCVCPLVHHTTFKAIHNTRLKVSRHMCMVCMVHVHAVSHAHMYMHVRIVRMHH